MITIDLRDPNLRDNLNAIKELSGSGLFTDEQIQEMYNKQVEKDREKGGETDEG